MDRNDNNVPFVLKIKLMYNATLLRIAYIINKVYVIKK